MTLADNFVPQMYNKKKQEDLGPELTIAVFLVLLEPEVGQPRVIRMVLREGGWLGLTHV